jgi:hypothetical protein
MLPSATSQWLTPMVPNGGRCVPASVVEAKGRTADGKKTVGLESQSKHWATPNAHDGRRPGVDDKSTQGGNLNRDAASWPTPAARIAKGGGQRRDATGWQEQARHAGLGGRGLFAPGPDDSRWPDIIAERPDLAPATEPGVRGVVDGYPVVVDESRANQLRAIGNGVVPLQAATAIVCLMRRLGLGE